MPRVSIRCSQQPDVLEIIVVDDQSTDRTAEIVRERMAREPRIKLLETSGVPQGWVGKNHAAAEGAKVASQAWLLFVDADAELLPGAGAKAAKSRTNPARDSFLFRRSKSPSNGTRKR